MYISTSTVTWVLAIVTLVVMLAGTFISLTSYLSGMERGQRVLLTRVQALAQLTQAERDILLIYEHLDEYKKEQVKAILEHASSLNNARLVRLRRTARDSQLAQGSDNRPPLADQDILL